MLKTDLYSAIKSEDSESPLYFFQKNLTTFSLVGSSAVSPLISSSQKLTTFFLLIALSLSLGYHPLEGVTLHLFYLSDLVSPLFFVNLHTQKFFSFGITPWRVSHGAVRHWARRLLTSVSCRSSTPAPDTLTLACDASCAHDSTTMELPTTTIIHPKSSLFNIRDSFTSDKVYKGCSHREHPDTVTAQPSSIQCYQNITTVCNEYLLKQNEQYALAQL